MSDPTTLPEPPPVEDADWLPPLPPDDRFSHALPDEDEFPAVDPWLLEDDGWVPADHLPLSDLPPLDQDGLGGFAPPEPADDRWSWQDARLIGVERDSDSAGRYEIGAIDVYADAATGDLGGSYLKVAAFADVAVATAFYHDLQQLLLDQAAPAHQVPAFAAEQAAAIQPEPSSWRGATAAEYAAYEHLRQREGDSRSGWDEPPEDALDPLAQTALELGGVVGEFRPRNDLPAEADGLAFQALNAIGIAADGFDPTRDPPPLVDAATGTAYWIGVFQPDRDDREHCVTSILSLGRHPETGELEAQLAPCVPGEWDKAYNAAEYLIQVAQKGGIERCFDAAEGMALATDQRQLWQTERGLALEAGSVGEIAAYTRDEWEVEL